MVSAISETMSFPSAAQTNLDVLFRPTAVESGYPNYSTGTIWQGFFAPANTPRDIVVRLNAEIRKAVETPEVRASLVAAGAEIVLNSPDEFARELREESAIWAKAIATAGLQRQ